MEVGSTPQYYKTRLNGIMFSLASLRKQMEKERSQRDLESIKESIRNAIEALEDAAKIY
tara:strand:- start:212 stop:388 length:177 start_codon:yes stop_codon:yes gene_type:complete